MNQQIYYDVRLNYVAIPSASANLKLHFFPTPVHLLLFHLLFSSNQRMQYHVAPKWITQQYLTVIGTGSKEAFNSTFRTCPLFYDVSYDLHY